jgi:hypothetical protein
VFQGIYGICPGERILEIPWRYQAGNKQGLAKQAKEGVF